MTEFAASSLTAIRNIRVPNCAPIADASRTKTLLDRQRSATSAAVGPWLGNSPKIKFAIPGITWIPSSDKDADKWFRNLPVSAYLEA
jgi:hypothetical protein